MDEFLKSLSKFNADELLSKAGGGISEQFGNSSLSGMSGIKDIVSGAVDVASSNEVKKEYYLNAKIHEQNQKQIALTSKNIINNAVKNMNLLKQKFMSDLGSNIFINTMRGVAGFSQGLQDTVKISAQNLGDDLKTIETNRNRNLHNLRLQNIRERLQARLNARQGKHEEAKLIGGGGQKIVSGLAKIVTGGL